MGLCLQIHYLDFFAQSIAVTEPSRGSSPKTSTKHSGPWVNSIFFFQTKKIACHPFLLPLMPANPGLQFGLVHRFCVAAQQHCDDHWCVVTVVVAADSTIFCAGQHVQYLAHRWNSQRALVGMLPEDQCWKTVVSSENIKGQQQPPTIGTLVWEVKDWQSGLRWAPQINPFIPSIHVGVCCKTAGYQQRNMSETYLPDGLQRYRPCK